VVNVASRLEEKTKVYGVPIIAGERTAAGAPKMAFLQIEAAKIRGKERVEKLFALIGDETVAESDRFLALRNANTRLQQALAAGETAAAEVAMKECRARAWPEVLPLYENLAARITEAA
jgi:adenylate cyclase